MTSKSSKNFYLIGCTAILIAIIFVLSSCSDQKTEPEKETAETKTETVKEETAKVEKAEAPEAAMPATEEIKAQVDDAKAEAEDTVSSVEATAEEVASKPVVKEQTGKTQVPAALLNSFAEGDHYITKFPNDTRAKGPVVVEFFSYMCPHCYNLERPLKIWLKDHKPEDVKFIKVPVSFPGNAFYERTAKAHYIAEKLGLMTTFPDRMFKRIHIDRRPPRSDGDLINFFGEFGVSKAQFEAAEKSFEVQSKLRRADILRQNYQVNGVPYLLLNYKYELGPKTNESQEQLYKVLSYLPLKDFQ